MTALPGFAALEVRFGDVALLAPAALYVCTWLFGFIPPSLAPHTGIGFNRLSWQHARWMHAAWIGDVPAVTEDWWLAPGADGVGLRDAGGAGALA
jgi:hypothetical protein